MRLRKSSSHKAAAQHRRGPGECRNAVLLTHICLSQISSCSVCRLPSALNRTLPIHSFFFDPVSGLKSTGIYGNNLKITITRAAQENEPHIQNNRTRVTMQSLKLSMFSQMPTGPDLTTSTFMDCFSTALRVLIYPPSHFCLPSPLSACPSG